MMFGIYFPAESHSPPVAEPPAATLAATDGATPSPPVDETPLPPMVPIEPSDGSTPSPPTP